MENNNTKNDGEKRQKTKKIDRKRNKEIIKKRDKRQDDKKYRKRNNETNNKMKKITRMGGRTKRESEKIRKNEYEMTNK